MNNAMMINTYYAFISIALVVVAGAMIVGVGWWFSRPWRGK